MTDEAVPSASLPAFSYLLLPSDVEKAKQDRKKLDELVRQRGFRAVRYEERPEDVNTRPRLTRLLARARSREHGSLVVLRMNDLAGTRVRVAKIVCELHASGVTVIAASGIELGPKAARWLADEEVVHRRRIKRALDEKRERGERTGEIPYGWRLYRDGVHLVEEGYEQSVIREAKLLAFNGSNPGEIERMLARQGWRNRAGRAHGRGAIRRWLKRGW